METTEDREQSETNRLIRHILLRTGQKCRLCEVIVQPVAGDIEQGMRMHKHVVHGINGQE